MITTFLTQIQQPAAPPLLYAVRIPRLALRDKNAIRSNSLKKSFSFIHTIFYGLSSKISAP